MRVPAIARQAQTPFYCVYNVYTCHASYMYMHESGMEKPLTDINSAKNSEMSV